MKYFGMELSLLFCNPFRKDDKPSCSCAVFNNHYIFKDWTLNKSYNWVGVAALHYKFDNIDNNDKLTNNQYQLTINKVYDELVKDKCLCETEQEELVKKEVNIKVKLRKWNKQDEQYWFPLTEEMLLNTKTPVYPISYITIDNVILCRNEKNNPTYGYYHKDYSTTKEYWKIYKPLDKNGNKWLSNLKTNMISYGF